jgi:uncharacterized membrane protein YuzA (DUF378 family)
MNKTWCIIVVILSAIGAINWGLVGAFNFDVVAALFGSMSMLSRIIYVIIGISGIILLFSIKCILKCCDSNKNDQRSNMPNM